MESRHAKVWDSVPKLWSAFVDTFLDYAVSGGYVLGPESRSFHPKDIKSSLADPIRTVLPPADRVVAIGDLHGDIKKTREALRIAQLIDEQDRWIGGSSVLVQVGDQLDRGGDELAILYLLERLRREAPRSGGQVCTLYGNHETGNIDGWFKYADAAGMQDFDRWASWTRKANFIKARCTGVDVQMDPLKSVPSSVPPAERARYAALRPGGPISTRLMSSHSAVLVVGNSVFVHGGLHPVHIQYGIDRLNREAREWTLGAFGTDPATKGSPTAPLFFRGPDALVWSRRFSERKESRCECGLLQESLRLLPGVQRMVVGHTIQQPGGINGVCGNQVVRTDVGMSAGCYDAPPEVLEIVKGVQLRVLSRQGSRPLENSQPLPTR